MENIRIEQTHTKKTDKRWIYFSVALLVVALSVFVTYTVAYNYGMEKGILAGSYAVIEEMCVNQKPLYLTEDHSKAFVCIGATNVEPQVNPDTNRIETIGLPEGTISDFPEPTEETLEILEKQQTIEGQ